MSGREFFSPGPWAGQIPLTGDEQVRDLEELRWSIASVYSKESFLEGEGWSVCFAYLPNSLLLTVLPIPSAERDDFVGDLFDFLWRGKSPLVCFKVYCLHPAESSLGIPNVKTCQYTLCLNFLEWMCTQEDVDNEKHLPIVPIPGKCAYRRGRVTLCFVLQVKDRLWHPGIVSKGVVLSYLEWGANYRQNTRWDWLYKSGVLLYHPGWNVSIMTRHHSPGLCCKGSSGSAKSFAQCGWQFHQRVCTVVTWKSPLDMPSLTAASCTHCAGWLKTTFTS